MPQDGVSNFARDPVLAYVKVTTTFILIWPCIPLWFSSFLRYN